MVEPIIDILMAVLSLTIKLYLNGLLLCSANTFSVL